MLTVLMVIAEIECGGGLDGGDGDNKNDGNADVDSGVDSNIGNVNCGNG